MFYDYCGSSLCELGSSAQLRIKKIQKGEVSWHKVTEQE